MPTTVENRVVEMEFDNKRFEANVKETMTSIEKLKEALTFKGLKSGFDEIEQSAKKLNLSPLEKSVDAVKDKFSAMEVVAVTALVNIANKAVNAGEQLLKSLTIQPVTEGFNKYAEKTQAVQTIMNSTGKSIDEVNAQLDKLAWFTDETSYSFTDMVSNIGKFTSNAVDLDTAVTAMQGISTWAAKSGANVQQASHAMYNLSQALAAGSVKKLDWKSIENANISTAEFKQTAIDAAIELGKLEKVEDGVGKTTKGNIVNIKTFTDTLAESWFTTDVLLKSLDKYGDFTNKLYEAIGDSDVTASTMIASIDKFKNGTLDVEKLSEELGRSAEETRKIMEDLSSDAYDFGRKSFLAAQEAKTFKEAIEATKEAVSSGWMETYEHIFGNYKEAVKLWTSVSNIMYTLFAERGNRRNTVLAEWKELADGGRATLIDAVSNAFMALWTAMKPVKEAFHDIFGEMDANKLASFVSKLKDFTSRLKISDATAQNLRDAFKGLFTVFKQIGEGFVDLVKKGQPVYKVLIALVRLFIALAGAAGRWAQKQQIVNKIFAGFVTVVKAGLTVIMALVYGVITLVGKMAELANWLNEVGVFRVITTPVQVLAGAIAFLYQSIRSLLSLSLQEIPDFIKSIDARLSALAYRIKQFPVVQQTVQILSTAFEAIGNVLSKIGEKITPVWNFFKDVADLISQGKWQEAFTMVSDKLKEIVDSLKTMIVDGLFGSFKDENGNVLSARDKLEQFNLTLAKFRENLSIGKIVAIGFSVTMLALAASITRLSDSTRGVMDSLKGLITSGNKIMRSLAARTAPVRQFAEAIAIVAASLALLSAMDQEKLKSSAKYIAGIMGTLAVFATVMAVISRGSMKHDFRDFSKNINAVAISVIALAVGVAALTASMLLLEHVSIDTKIFAKIAIIGVLMAGLVAAGVALAKFTPKLSAGGLVLVLYALSVKKIVEALVAFNDIDVSGLSNKVISLISLMSGLAILAMGMGQIKLSSVLGVLLLAATFKMVVPIFRDEIIPAINDFSISLSAMIEKLAITLKQIIGAKNTMKLLQTMSNDLRKTMVATIVSFSGLMATIAIFGKSMKNIGKGIGYFAVGISALLLAIGGLMTIMSKKEVSPFAFKAIAEFVESILTYMVHMIAIAAVFSGSKFKGLTLGGGEGIFGQFAKMMKAMSFFFISIIAFVAIASLVASGENLMAFAMAATMVNSILFLMTTIIGAAAAAGHYGGTEVLKQVKGIAVALDLIMVLVVVLSAVPQEDLLKAEFALFEIISMFSILIYLAEKVVKGGTIMRSFKSNAAMAVLVIGGIMALAVSILALATIPGENAGFKALAAVGNLILLFGGIVAIIKDLNSSVKTAPKFIGVMEGLVMAMGALALVAVAIIAVASLSPSWNRTLASMLSLLIVFGVVAAVLEKMAKTGKTATGIVTTAGAIVLASSSLLVIAGAIIMLSKMTNKMSDAQDAAEMLVVLMGSIVLALGLLDKFAKDKLGLLAVAGAVDLMALSFIVIAKALKMLENYDTSKMIGTLTAMSVTVGLMAAIVAIVGGFLGGSGVGWMAIAGILALAAAVDLLALVFLIAAKSVEISLNAMYKLPEFLNAMIAIPSEDVGTVAKELVVLSEAIKKFGAAGFMLSFGSGGLITGSVGIISLTKGLMDLGKVSMDPNWLAAISDALGILGKAGVGLTVGAGGYIASGIGLRMLSSGLIAIDETGLEPNDITEYAKSFADLSTSGLGLLFAAPGLIVSGAALKILASGLDDLAYSSNNLEAAAPYAAEGFIENVTSSETQRRMATAGATFAMPFLLGAYKIWGYNSPWSTTDNAVDFATAGMAQGVADNESNMTKIGGNFALPFISKFFKVMTSTAMAGVDTSVDVVAQSVDDNEQNLKASGEKAGDSVGSGFASSISEWFSNIGTGIANWWNKYMAHPGVFMIPEAIKEIGTNAKNAWKNGGATGVANYVEELFNGWTEKISDTVLNFGEFSGVNDLMEEFGLVMSDSNDLIKDAMDSANAMADSYNDMGSSATKTKTFVEQLTDTIEQQMDVFTEFNSKTETTGEQMLNNMASQVSGVRQWAENLKYLAERGIDDGLLQKLTELGPAGYEKVAAFVNMTDEQLQMAGSLFQESVSIPESTSKEVSRSWWKTGEEMAASLSKGVSSETSKSSVNTAAKEVSKEVQKGIEQTTPELTKTGEKATDTVGKGMTDRWAKQRAKQWSIMTGDSIKDPLNDNLMNEKDGMLKIGQQVSIGLKNGMESKTEEVTTKSENLATRILNAFKRIFKIESPSKEAFKIGEFFIEGFVLGLANSNYKTIKETENSAYNILDAFNQTLNSNYDIATFSPTVRPVLDLTSFDQDYSKFSSIMDAGYSKSLSGSMNTYTSFDDSLLAALEDIGDNSDVVNEVKSLRGSIADMTQQISKMQVVLDSGTMVGALVTPLDQALGSKAIRSRRERG